MMGGGFGGAVIALVNDADVGALTTDIADAYQAATGRVATIYAAHAGPGSGLIALS